MVTLTTRGTTIYIHKDKQTYKFQRKTSIKETYKCKFDGCRSKIMKIDHKCYQNIKSENHNHPQNSAKTFKNKIKRIFALRVLERMLKEDGKIDYKKANDIIQVKAGKVKKNVLRSLKNRPLRKTKAKNTGLFIMVEPVQLIPSNRIKNIINGTDTNESAQINLNF